MEGLARLSLFRNDFILFHFFQSHVEVAPRPPVEYFPVDDEAVEVIVFCYSAENFRKLLSFLDNCKEMPQPVAVELFSRQRLFPFFDGETLITIYGPLPSNASTNVLAQV